MGVHFLLVAMASIGCKRMFLATGPALPPEFGATCKGCEIEFIAHLHSAASCAIGLKCQSATDRYKSIRYTAQGISHNVYRIQHIVYGIPSVWLTTVGTHLNARARARCKSHANATTYIRQRNFLQRGSASPIVHPMAATQRPSPGKGSHSGVRNHGKS